MSDSSNQDRTLLDCVRSPLTIVPLMLGVTLLVAPLLPLPPTLKSVCIVAGIVAMLISPGIAFTLWIWPTGGDPKAEAAFLANLDHICRTDQYDAAPEAERAGTPAVMEKT